jgi:hypothetical protein
MAILSCGLWRWAVGTAAWEREGGGTSGLAGWAMEWKNVSPSAAEEGRLGGKRRRCAGSRSGQPERPGSEWVVRGWATWAPVERGVG